MSFHLTFNLNLNKFEQQKVYVVQVYSILLYKSLG